VVPLRVQGGMPSFTILKGKAAALDLQNIDTDMIIPKQFLKTVKRTGLGISAFYEMRYDQTAKNEETLCSTKMAIATQRS
jgi:3-isopropylmalate dehydratase